MTSILEKMSPLHGSYRNHQGQFIQVDGWSIAEHCSHPEKEKAHLQEGCVLVDWSHIEKISLRGEDAALAASQVNKKAASLKPLQTHATQKMAILRLTADQFLVLAEPGQGAKILKSAQAPHTDTFSYQGAMGCLVLAGERRDEVIERSCAMNLRRDLVTEGSVVQTTFHTIRCTLYRTNSLDILLHSRDYSDSLFEAFMDVGHGVGLIPSGVATLPVLLK